MKICHIVPSYYPAIRYGGPILAIHHMCKSLVQLGHEVTVLTTNLNMQENLDVPLDRAVDIDGVKVLYYPVGILRRWFFSWDLRKSLQTIIPQMDFVHLHSLFLWPTFQAARIAKKNRIPYCISPHGALVPELLASKSRYLKKIAFQLFENKNLIDASFIHATAKLEEKNIRSVGIPINSIEILELALEVAPNDDVYDDCLLEIDAPYLLFLGRISWKKQIKRIISALPFVSKDLHLIIAGYDDEDLTASLKIMADDLGVIDRVHFIGPVQGRQKQEILSKAAALVLPSLHENFGMVILESWANGRPVLLSENIGLFEPMLAAKAGVAVPDHPQAFAELINHLIANPKILDEMGQNGLNLVKERYSWGVRAQELANTYKQYCEVSR
jgi:glycosyltransferase involved in cell wall biosynthesis